MAPWIFLPVIKFFAGLRYLAAGSRRAPDSAPEFLIPLKRCKRLSTMARVFWIASYPKSGNTWARFIIANLIRGPVTRSHDVEHLTPDVHKFGDGCFRDDADAIVKTHWPLTPTMPHRGETTGAVYMVRNPLDIMASGMAYLGRTSASERATFIDEFVTVGGLLRWQRQGFGTWPEHVQSWIRTDLDFPTLVLRYEDALADHRGAVLKMAAFFGLTRTPEQIDQVVSRTTFDAMRRMEQSEVHLGTEGGFFRREAHNQRNIKRTFMRRGVVGSYREVLDNRDIDRVLERFAPTMAEVGYEVASFL